MLCEAFRVSYSGNKYRIVGKFGKHYIWRIGGKMHLASFNLARDPLTQYTMNAILVSFNIDILPQNSPNCQI